MIGLKTKTYIYVSIHKMQTVGRTTLGKKRKGMGLADGKEVVRHACLWTFKNDILVLSPLASSKVHATSAICRQLVYLLEKWNFFLFHGASEDYCIS